MADIKNTVDPAHENAWADDFARIVMDARVFEIIPADETAVGWDETAQSALREKVRAAWQPYAGKVSALPDDLRMRHAIIHENANKARESAEWDPTIDGDD